MTEQVVGSAARTTHRDVHRRRALPAHHDHEGGGSVGVAGEPVALLLHALPELRDGDLQIIAVGARVHVRRRSLAGPRTQAAIWQPDRLVSRKPPADALVSTGKLLADAVVELPPGACAI